MSSRNQETSAFFAFLGLLWKVYTGYSGHECDHRRPGGCSAHRPLEHRVALRWHHLPRYARAGAALAVTTVLYGLAVARTFTLILLAVLFAAGAVLGAWQCVYLVRNWRHMRHYVRPLERTLMRGIPAAPDVLEITRGKRDRDVIEGVVIEWPADTEITTADQNHVLQSVTTRLPFEAPDVTWRLKGRSRMVTCTRSEPPPSAVTWEDIFPAIQRAAANELVFGLGKRRTVITAAYSESPHIGVPGGSGGGKSNSIAVLVLQELMRGTLVIILDPKGDSHAWAINLPNVIYCVAPEQIHMALGWLGGERKRRATNAYLSAARDGIIHALPGVRIVVVCEELNIGMPELKALWIATRTKEDPKESPAIAGLRQVACAGRSCDIHAVMAAQMFNVESTGVKDSAIRSQTGIKAMHRWDLNGWNMAVGKDVPMPPRTSHPGRTQIVTGDAPRETQVPYLHLDDKDQAAAVRAVRWARELAVSKAVAAIPTGPHGVPPELWPSDVPAPLEIEPGAGQDPNDIGQRTPAALTVNEALVARIFGDRSRDAAAKLVQRAISRGDIKPVTEPRRGRESKYRPEDLRKVAGGDE